ncbi:phage antirepressor [Pseudomonas sp. A46]|nr:BRO family protein [Pseudomonas sp. A46]OWJ93387.1 phage antirepressor [Pseudomonas sp. A46]
MQLAHTPILFYHHDQPLRAVMIDHQPWFIATDLCRLIGARYPHRLLKALEPFEKRSLLLECPEVPAVEVDAISDAGAYKALLRFDTPENREVARWMSEVLVPTLHDYHRDPDAEPRRSFLLWADQRIGVVKWQREVWVAWRDLPVFMEEGTEVRPG